MGRHRGEVIACISKIQQLISELFILADKFVGLYDFANFQYITSFHRGDLQSATTLYQKEVKTHDELRRKERNGN